MAGTGAAIARSRGWRGGGVMRRAAAVAELRRAQGGNGWVLRWLAHMAVTLFIAAAAASVRACTPPATALHLPCAATTTPSKDAHSAAAAPATFSAHFAATRDLLFLLLPR